jgi:hypothetical protein
VRGQQVLARDRLEVEDVQSIPRGLDQVRLLGKRREPVTGQVETGKKRTCGEEP